MIKYKMMFKPYTLVYRNNNYNNKNKNDKI